jgi:hypothetical protein
MLRTSAHISFFFKHVLAKTLLSILGFYHGIYEERMTLLLALGRQLVGFELYSIPFG